MKKIIFFYLFWLCGILTCNSQTTATIKIISDQNTTAQIFGNIDGAFQPYYYSIAHLPISENTLSEYNVDVGEWAFIQINLPRRLFLLLLPDDEVTIISRNGNISIEGSNAVGHHYYDQNWNGTQTFISKLEAELQARDNYAGYIKTFSRDFVIPVHSTIDSMVNNGDIAELYASVIKQDIEYYQYTSLLRKLKNLHLNKPLSDIQRSQVLSLQKTLHEQIANYDDTIGIRLYLGSYFITDKYEQAYASMDIHEQKALHQSYSSSTFGPYSHYLIAPKRVQIAKFFDCIMIQYIYKFNEFSPTELTGYLKDIAPTSQSVSILSNIEASMTNATDNKGIRYIESEINTLRDIVHIPELSGNYCLVDLWATWCVPCRKEFSHNKELYGVLSEYDNIKQVYISIDDISDKQQWEELIEKYDLQGSHFIANPELRHAIIKQIYDNRPITIPRYILLSPSGEVLCSDFPHPHDLQKISAALKGYIKK